MSLMNIVVHPNTAYVAVDTAVHRGDLPDTPMVNADKFFVLPNAMSLLVAVGSIDLMHALRRCVEHRPAAPMENFDDLAAAIPGFLKELVAYLETEYPKRLCSTDIALVGWSPAAGRMDCMAYGVKRQDDGGLLFDAVSAPDGVISPGIPDQPFMFAGVTSMRAYGRQQVSWARQAHPGMAIGGRLLVVEMTKNSIDIKNAGSLD